MSFHKATKSLAKELDPQGDLIPIRSIIDHKHYRPLCLLYRKANPSWWKTDSFRKTEYKLTDVLRSGCHAVKLDVKYGDQFAIENQVDRTLQGQFSGSDTPTIEGENISTISVRSVKMKQIKLCPTILNSVTKIKIDMDHEFIKQSKKHKKDLYIVTEAVKAVEDTKFEDTTKMKCSIFYETYLKMMMKVARNRRTAISIPESCTLAFRAKKLTEKNGSLRIFYYSDEKIGTWVSDEPVDMQRTVRMVYKERNNSFFPRGRKMSEGEISKLPAIHSKESIRIEVEVECAEFSSLSGNLRCVFLTGFVAVMRNMDLLQKLEFQLEEALEAPCQYMLKADEPELQDLVENLQDRNGVIIIELVKTVVYFLEALDELQEEQLMLLEESVEKKIVSGQLALVEIILGSIVSNSEMRFTIDAQLLPKEEMIITGAMIEMSGVTIQETEVRLTGTGEPEALMPLYVVLYVLSLLSKQEDD